MYKLIGIGGRLSHPYELEKEDLEIVRLTNKEHPHFLFLGHASIINNEHHIDKQLEYFNNMKELYAMCECKVLLTTDLNNKEYVQELIDWSDIIYEGGGNTLDMIELWHNTGFDHILLDAYHLGKVMTGISAGANCYFEECSSDSLQIKYGEDQPIIKMSCLGFIKGMFVPHCEESNRLETTKEFLKGTNQIALCMSNGTSLEVIDHKYRLIVNGNGYGLKCYWDHDTYMTIPLDKSDTFKPLDELYNQTLDYYNSNASKFTSSTVDVNFTTTQDTFLSYLKEGSLILDLGCGSGRDTKYFLGHNYQVEAIDGSIELCKIASKYTGIEVKHMLFNQLDINNYYDGIWACSSILHCNIEELVDVLQRIEKALKNNGYFYTSFKYGNYSGIRNGRYFTDLDEDSFNELIKDTHFTIIKEWVSNDVRKDRENEKWLNIILQKEA